LGRALHMNGSSSKARTSHGKKQSFSSAWYPCISLTKAQDKWGVSVFSCNFTPEHNFLIAVKSHQKGVFSSSGG